MRSTESEVFQAALAQVSDAVLVSDEKGTIVSVNRHMEHLFGYDPGVLVGKRVEVLVPERLRDAHRGHRRRLPGEAHRRAMGETSGLVGLRADGSEFQAEISLRPVNTPEGWLTVVVVRDLAEAPRLAPEHFVVPREADH